MILLITGAWLILLLAGLFAFLAQKSVRAATVVGAGGCVAGCLVGLVPAGSVLWTGQAESLKKAWSMPGGSFAVELDALSAVFLIPILIVSALAAVYGVGYLRGHAERRSLGFVWLSYNLLVASMVLVVLARNAVLFLLAWEIMSLASFFLVMFEDEKEGVRKAGWLYLVATHLGTAFLIAFFVLMANAAGSPDFDRWPSAVRASTPLGTMVFLFAVIGFGTKAGIIPFHVWLPEAHPAAPSFVSAVMSGVMIKTGIYGLIRTLTFFDLPPSWWGGLFIAIGLSSGVLGVLYALAQHDLKRLLAYHSVENIGIIALGIGTGLLGLNWQQPVIAQLGFAGALLHVTNHALFKSGLFLGAGSVLHATGTLDLEHLGGLIKRMPSTARSFLICSAAIAGLPPLNGFVSKFLIYYAAFLNCASASPANILPSIGVIAGLALIGGLAAACFAKAFGIVFLGEPRSEHAAHAHESGRAMRIPMYLLAAGCVAIGLLSPCVVAALGPALQQLTGGEVAWTREPQAGPLRLLLQITFVAAFLILGSALLALLRRRLLAGRGVTRAPTWDCGYVKPTARMQYTASSFAQPLMHTFRTVIRSQRKLASPRGLFPSESSLTTETPDGFREVLFKPVFSKTRDFFAQMRWLQHGRLQIYILYIAITLITLLIWCLRKS